VSHRWATPVRGATLVFGIVALSPAAAFAQDEWDAALQSVVRLEVSAFPELPAGVVASLQAQGCAVPQTYSAAERQNVISGQFGADTRTQWAVLCTVADTSAILVLGETGEELGALQRSPDRQWLQGIGGGRIGYSRLLRTAGRDEILRRTANLAGRVPAIERDGIEEIFIEKASVVWYWDGGVWMSLPGLD